jgi:glycine/D-amino acid oxidase-like deaminating enzyme
MGSTSASTALLQYEIDTPLVQLRERIGVAAANRAYVACAEAIDKIAALAVEVGDDCSFQKKESVYLATRAGEGNTLQEEARARHDAGLEVDFLDEATVASLFSFRRPAALLSRQAAELDAYRFTHQLLRRAAQRGLRIFDRTTVAKFDAEKAEVRLQTETGLTVRARHVVFATGYESANYLPERVVKLKSTFAVASEPLERFPGWHHRCLLWETARPYVYLRTTCDERAIIGGADDPFRAPARRDRLVPKKAALLTERFRELFPRIDFEPAFAWAGTFGETKDGLAYIGAVRQRPGCLFACGFGGNGITFSVLAAEIIRDAILGRQHPDAHLFRFDR